MTAVLPLLQRAQGRAEVAVAQRDAASRLDRLFQEGCAKALLPRVHGDGPLEAVLTNTAGGVTGGDRIAYSLTAGPGSRLVVTTQAAERVYRAGEGVARIEARLEVGAGAHLEWLPQETILYDGGRLARRLEADLSEDAELTAIETVMLGRAAMGETVATGALSDQWRIRRDGVLVHAEALRMAGDLASTLAGPGTLSGCRAFATLAHVAPDAPDRLVRARALIAGLSGIAAAASAKDGVLLVRFIAPDLAPLRAALIAFLIEFRRSALPRVWSL